MENSVFMFMYSKDFLYGHSLQLLLDQSLLPPLRLTLVTQPSSLSYFCKFSHARKHKSRAHLPFFLLLFQNKSVAVTILQFSSPLLVKQ